MDSLNLKQIFGLSGAYSNFAPLKDVKIGFSVQREYPPDIEFKPPKYRDGKDAVVAVLQVVYNYPDHKKTPIDLEKVPLLIRIFPFNEYTLHHFDYNFDDEKCPTKESVHLSGKTQFPVEWRLVDQYFIKHSSQQIIDKKNNPISGKEIFDNLFKKHCNITTRYDRFVNVLNKVVISILNLIIKIIEGILLIFFGRKIERSDESTNFKTLDKSAKTQVINIYGYEVPKNMALFFCGGISFVYVIYRFFNIKNAFMYHIATSALLSLCFSIILLVILDLTAYILFSLIKLLDEAKKLTYRT